MCVDVFEWTTLYISGLLRGSQSPLHLGFIVVYLLLVYIVVCLHQTIST